MGRVTPRSHKPLTVAPNPQQEIAWKAVRNLNRMLPTLTGFVRSLTGNKKLIVRSGQMTSTDGKVVTIRPPLALGVELRHERNLCDERDEHKVALCPACRNSDDLWRKLHHETAHILLGSFDEPSLEVIAAMSDLVDEWHPKGVCNHASRINADVSRATEYLPMFNAFSKFLWLINQSLDDARIDAGMLKVKPGLRNQFYANDYLTFAEGIETDGGVRKMWRDAPINGQVIIGLLLVGSGYEILEDWLRPEVLDILDDEQLYSIISHASEWGSVHEASMRTIAVFRRLNEMGLCVVEKCVPPEPTPPSLNNPSNEEQSDDGDPQSGESEEAGDASDSDDDSKESDSDGGDDPGSTRSSDDPGDPTGTGEAGDSTDDGAFGKDFENEDTSSDGSDKEGGDSSSESEEDPLSDDDGDSDGNAGGDEAGEREAESDAQSGSDGGEDQTDSVDPAGASDPSEAGDDETQKSSEDDSAATDAGESTDDAGDDPAQDGDGHAAGESAGPAEASESEDGDDGDVLSDEGESTVDGADDSETVDPDGDEVLEEDVPREIEAKGEEVWSEENDGPESQAVRSFEPEELGTEDDAEDYLQKFTGHESHEDIHDNRLEGDDEDAYGDDELLVVRGKALDEAIIQAGWFDRASVGVGGVVEYTFPEPLFKWTDSYYGVRFKDFMPSEAVIGKSLLKARVVFAENKRGRYQHNLKSGKVDTRVLGRRAGLGDDRLFRHKDLPGKRDYIVAISVDCSGSTETGTRMERIKRAVFAKAELLNRLGVKFYITGHTGGMERWWTEGYSYNKDYGDELENLMMLWIKKVDEPWNDATRKRLALLMPLANNFDGHTLEFHRKILERRQETDKILIYYTDGAMPAANYDEELTILLDELAQYERKGIKRLAVGINTDSPKRYGFDTVRVDSDDDLIKVVTQLERHLL